MIDCKVSSRTLQSNESVVPAGDNESKNYSTFDVVLSQFERFHVDSQQAKHSAFKMENCSELDTTVEDLAVSISTMDFAKKETLEIRTFRTLKSDSFSLHKLHDEKCPTSPHKHRRRATGRHRNHRHWSRFCSIKNVRIYFSQLKINESAALSDDSSVIFVSDMSVSDVESVNLDDEDAILDEDDEESVDNEMQVVSETITTTEIITKTEETILKVDKSTQTYENEFPVQSVASPGTLALPSMTSTPKKKINVLSVSAVNCLNISAARDPTLSQKSTSNIQSVPYVSLVNIRKNPAIDSIHKLNAINNNENTDKKTDKNTASTSGKSNNLNTVDKNKKNDTKDLATISSKSKNFNAVNDKENRGKHDTVSKSKNDKNSQSSVRRTWTKSRSYQNHRVQPYQRYNNYYSGRQNDYDRYGGRRNDYYDNSSYGYRGRYRSEYQTNNRYNSNPYGYCAPYNSYNPQQSWQVQHYTYQFKERLFTGFVRFMDFVFQYDYTRRN
ncbi:GATA zinc finger domain-containing protein 4-like isoform X2 [Nasonia vitripennis]|uniref:Uncharacterized protein n=1 Tax=Nasonia vitripennis TaxID=7425 RepID=A0A7M7IWU1_NASVI|nr:GATA zinc finger domain-containing protein 4-like isoform X2 [Nasonia vitripennis]